MKVVIFCGGFGVRMGEETQRIPKPMIEIGGRPILWHIMRYYADVGPQRVHPLPRLQGRGRQGVLPHLQRGAAQRLRARPRRAAARSSSCSRATSTSGASRSSTPALNATIGERLKAVEPYLGDDETFLATYGDGLTDAPLPQVIAGVPREREDGDVPVGAAAVQRAPRRDRRPTATSLAVEDMSRSDVRINGGFFVFKREILDLIEPGDELVEETFARLIAERELVAYPYDGFFGPMDTIKDRQRLETLHESGRRAVAPLPRRRPAERRDARGRTC